MKLLLDTHTFLWWDSAPDHLSAAARAALEDPNNEVWLSVVSLWEITIKASLGKLTIGKPLHDILQDQVDRGLQVLPLLTAHVLYVGQLPAHHKDPFDRALIAQTFVEQACLVSQDAMMTTYGVPVLW